MDREKLETACAHLREGIDGYTKLAKNFTYLVIDLRQVLAQIESALEEEKPFMYLDGDKIELEPAGESVGKGERKYSKWNQEFKAHLDSLSGEEE